MTNLCLEIILAAIITPPTMDYYFELNETGGGVFEYSVDGIISVIMLIRFLFVFKLLYHFSTWSGKGSEKTFKKFKLNPSMLFAIKAELKKRPFTLIFCAMGVIVSISALALRTFEMGNRDEDTKSLDFSEPDISGWVLIITLTTVGYGDGFPSTWMGRVVTSFACIAGAAFSNIMNISAIEKSQFTEDEYQSYLQIRKYYTYSKIRNEAANIIKCTIRLKWMNNEFKKQNSFKSRRSVIFLEQANNKLRKQLTMIQKEQKLGFFTKVFLYKLQLSLNSRKLKTQRDNQKDSDKSLEEQLREIKGKIDAFVGLRKKIDTDQLITRVQGLQDQVDDSGVIFHKVTEQFKQMYAVSNKLMSQEHRKERREVVNTFLADKS